MFQNWDTSNDASKAVAFPMCVCVFAWIIDSFLVGGFNPSEKY